MGTPEEPEIWSFLGVLLTSAFLFSGLFEDYCKGPFLIPEVGSVAVLFQKNDECLETRAHGVGDLIGYLGTPCIVALTDLHLLVASWLGLNVSGL